jgi:photosystem II stability/assembly factor-like uncharacterized protein
MDVDRALIWSMAIDFKTPGVLYVIGFVPGGIFKSTNGGVDWTQLIAPGSAVANAIPEGPSNPALAAIASISMDPTNPLHLIGSPHVNCVGTQTPLCVIETTDGGQKWTILNVPIPGVTGWLEQAGPYVLDATSAGVPSLCVVDLDAAPNRRTTSRHSRM